jgi:hypothetical protein
MQENEFLRQLQKRAKEQEKLMLHMPFPSFFTHLIRFLGNHPWRMLIPLAFVLTLLFRLVLGSGYSTLILRIFGGGIFQ